MAESNTPAPQDPSKLKIAAPKIAEAPVKRPWNLTTILAAAFLAIFTVGGVLGILSFVQAEKKRTLRDWLSRSFNPAFGVRNVAGLFQQAFCACVLRLYGA